VVNYDQIAENLLEAEKEAESFEKLLVTEEPVRSEIDHALRRRAGEKSMADYKNAGLGTLYSVLGTTILYNGFHEIGSSSPGLGALAALSGIGLTYIGGNTAGQSFEHHHTERTQSLIKNLDVEYFEDEATITYRPGDNR
jgi:hypothetical protein